MAPPPALTYELTWTGERFERDLCVRLRDDGSIAAVEPATSDEAGGERGPGKALLPGFVNAHSHAFQRGLRGRGERFEAGAGSFWSWREAMYALVDRLDETLIHRWSRRAFEEMLAAGITTVGEFHYAHHDASGAGYALDDAVLRAAADAGIRIVLLQAYYRTGGIGAPLRGGQRRFATPDLDAYWSQMDGLAGALRGPRQSLGAVAHSVRAVPPEDLAALSHEARRRGLVLHMHVEEQRQEIDDCRAAYGLGPLALVADRIELDERFTAVHCTHTTRDDLAGLAGSGANVCLCPLTEANLGDGIADVPACRELGVPICLGTDSNARIDFVEEARWLEYVQRLARERRGIVMDETGRVGPALLEAMTANGARALGLPAGRIAPGCHADFVALDLSAPALEGWTEDTLLETFLLGGGMDAIAGTMVGGVWAAR